VVWRLHAAFRDADKTIRPSGEKSDYSAEIAALDAALAEPDAIARAVEAEREAICPIVYGLCVSDNNAQEIVNAIRARGSDGKTA
jgi:hypothetical protein